MLRWLQNCALTRFAIRDNGPYLLCAKKQLTSAESLAEEGGHLAQGKTPRN